MSPFTIKTLYLPSSLDSRLISEEENNWSKKDWILFHILKGIQIVEDNNLVPEKEPTQRHQETHIIRSIHFKNELWDIIHQKAFDYRLTTNGVINFYIAMSIQSEDIQNLFLPLSNHFILSIHDNIRNHHKMLDPYFKADLLRLEHAIALRNLGIE